MSWKTFGYEIKERLVQSLMNETFIGYFLVCIVFFGSLGVFISIFDYDLANAYKIAFSMGTYSIAITASAFVDLNLSKRIKQKSSFLIYSLFILGTCIALLVATYFTKSNFAFVFSSIGCILSWIIWIIANSDNENLKCSFDESIYQNVKDHSKNW